jgi:hypothetical protein
VKIISGETFILDGDTNSGTAMLDHSKVHERTMTAEQVFKVLIAYGKPAGEAETLTVEEVEKGLELGHTTIYLDSVTGSIGLVSFEDLDVHLIPGSVQ